MGIGRKWLSTMNCHRGEVVRILFPDWKLDMSRKGPGSQDCGGCGKSWDNFVTLNGRLNRVGLI